MRRAQDRTDEASPRLHQKHVLHHEARGARRDDYERHGREPPGEPQRQEHDGENPRGGEADAEPEV